MPVDGGAVTPRRVITESVFDANMIADQIKSAAEQCGTPVILGGRFGKDLASCVAFSVQENTDGSAQIFFSSYGEGVRLTARQQEGLLAELQHFYPAGCKLNEVGLTAGAGKFARFRDDVSASQGALVEANAAYQCVSEAASAGLASQEGVAAAANKGRYRFGLNKRPIDPAANKAPAPAPEVDAGGGGSRPWWRGSSAR